MAAMSFEQVQRFILPNQMFWGYGHFEENRIKTTTCVTVT